MQFAAGGGGGEQCPKGSVYGHVSATTPILDYTLPGGKFLGYERGCESNSHLPQSDSPFQSHLHSKCPAPLTRPTCGVRPPTVKFTAQNNKAYEFNPALKAKCPKHKKGKKHKRHAR